MTQGMALITFETRPIEDRAASNAAGHWVGKDIEVACITPVGGRHTHEQEITADLIREWKNKPDNKYRYDAYMAWKEGVEPPVNGSDLRTWPPISPAQLKQFNSRNIRSVEELAELPDDALQSFGPGSRMIRDKAREWIKSSSDIGKVVAEMSILKDKIKTLEEEGAKKQQLVDQLLQRLAELEPESQKRPGRTRAA